MRIEREMMRGAGVLAVLKLLEQRKMYGYELAEALSERSEGILAMGHSTLYPMLYNLESKGHVEPFWPKADGGRPRKYYRLTAKGRKWLAVNETQWNQLVEAMSRFGLGGDVATERAR